jgi:acyl-CoA thioesterase-1
MLPRTSLRCLAPLLGRRKATSMTTSSHRAKHTLTFIGFSTALFIIGTGIAYAASALVVALGASQTAGEGVSESEAYPAQLEAILRSRGKDIRVINAGHSGETTDRMLARLDGDVPDDTKLVILQPGTNDAKYGGAIDHERNVSEMKKRLVARKIKILMWTHSDVVGVPLQSDGVHFTAEGYRMIAQRLASKVISLLQ